MAPISAERDGRIEDEFANIEYEADLLRRYLETFAGSEPADDLDYFQWTHTSSSATEKIYSGLERIVEIICVALDNQPAGNGDSNWHKQLLVRASQANPGFRGAILSASTFEALDRLRGFRHRERNSYFQALDLDVVIERAREAIAAITLLKADIQKFRPPPAAA